MKSKKKKMQLDENAIQWGVENEPIQEVERQLESWEEKLQRRREETEDAEMKVLFWQTIYRRKEGKSESKD